jgi:protein-L-isoaspartate(D-aspartate) O-methyltransferase
VNSVQNDATDVTSNADDLREAMIAELRQLDVIHSEHVVNAFRAVPRHLFAPEAPLREVYAARSAVVAKRDEHGVPISSVSAPEIQAFMLEQADIRPGMNVLEIGSGGYNAALITEIVGDDGTVTTVDIDPDVVGRATALLHSAGYRRVHIVLADAESGVPAQAPFDRIIVTVGAWDIPPAWLEQLRFDGLIVVPLRTRGLSRSLALERVGDHLASVSAKVCGFVKMQGAGAHRERLLLLRGDEIGLRFDDGGPDDVHHLDGVLATPRVAVWSGITVGHMESFEMLQFWLATSMPGFGLFAVDADQDDDLVDPGNRLFNLAAVDGDSFAYLISRPAGQRRAEFGAHGFGPRARAVAEALVEQVRIWDRDQRGGPGPSFEVWPKDTPDERLTSGFVLDKRHSRIVISWPDAGQATDQHSAE